MAYGSSDVDIFMDPSLLGNIPPDYRRNDGLGDWVKESKMVVKQYAVYIMFSKSRMLYVGMSNDLIRRVDEHRMKKNKGFAAKYEITMLAYYELYGDVWRAIEREKEIKKWRREKKIALIESMNPNWEDLTGSIKGV
jgi:putative endonuclease